MIQVLRLRKTVWIEIMITMVVIFLVSCTPKVNLVVQSPAEINTKNIKKVAIGKFEIAHVNESVLIERNGLWVNRPVSLSSEQKEAIANQVRAKVVNILGATPYFSLVYTDEFAKLENDAALQKLVSAQGYKSENVDAVINGKIWLEMVKIDGSDVSKIEMDYVQGGRTDGVNVTVEKIIWWPYKAIRGNLTLEMKMMRLDPTEVIAVNMDTRTFSHRIGGQPVEWFGSLISAAKAMREDMVPKKGKIENSENVFPSFEQLTSDLATSIATNFIRRVAVTEKVVSYPIAEDGDEQAIMLIKAGAYEMAISRLQDVTSKRKNPDDLYNLGLSYEAIGEYGLAAILYNDAWNIKKEELIYAKGIGRIERVLREYPQLKRQLSEKVN